MKQFENGMRRVLAGAMSVVMAVGLMPLPAYATGQPDDAAGAGLVVGAFEQSGEPSETGFVAGATEQAGDAVFVDASSASFGAGGLTALDAPVAASPRIVQVGEGIEFNNSTAPWKPFYYNTFAVQLYTSDELGRAVALSSVAFDFATSTAVNAAPTSIYLGHTTEATTGAAFKAPDDLTLVYSGNVALGSESGWQTFEFGTGEQTASLFDYNGTDNLLVVVVTHTTNEASGIPKCRYTQTASAKTSVAYSDGTSYSINNPPVLTTSLYRPNTRFGLRPGLPSVDAPTGDTHVKADGVSTGTLSVSAHLPEEGMAGSDGTLSYQWYRGDEPVAGATEASLTVTGSAVEKVDYRCVVTNTWIEDGVAQSASVSSECITVGFYDVDPAVPTSASVTGDPADGRVLKTCLITLAASAVVDATAGVEDPLDLSYQWYAADAKDGDYVPVEGATEQTFVPSTAATGTVYYQVGVRNNYYGGQSAEVLSPAFAVTVEGLAIKTAADLKAIADAVNGGQSFTGQTITLENDIDLQDLAQGGDPFSWTPIGTYASYSDYRAFEGAFDGNGHTVSGLYINDDSASDMGLFGFANNASISNLVVKGAGVTGKENAAGVVGRTAGATTLRNVGNEVPVSGCNSIGGVVGYVHRDTTALIGCYNKALVTASKPKGKAGGVVGEVYTRVNLTSCYNAATVTSTAEENENGCGGVVGYGSYGQDTTLLNCYNAGAVVVPGNYHGGLVGERGVADETNFWLKAGDSDKAGYSSTIVGNAVSADQLEGCANYPAGTRTLLVKDFLNAGDYAGTWSDGRVIGQASPVLAWEIPMAAPVITIQPKSAEYEDVSSPMADLSVVAAAQGGSLDYQWYEIASGASGAAGASGASGTSDSADSSSTSSISAPNPAIDTSIAGATAAAFSLDGVSAGTHYYYCAVVANGFIVLSDVAQVIVHSNAQAAKPVFTQQPQSGTAKLTLAADPLTVAAGFGDEPQGHGALTYQWYSCDGADRGNAVAVEGATDPVFTGVDTMASGQKHYFCRVTNTFEETKTATSDSDVATVTVSDSIVVETPAELLQVARNVNSGACYYDGLTVTLGADIDLASSEDTSSWTPIGDHGGSWSEGYHIFRGTFDGACHVISGLSVSRYDNAGLFGYVNGATVENVIVRGEGVKLSGAYGAGVIAHVDGGTVTVRNVGNEAPVNGNGGTVGGIVGQGMSGLSISNCYNTASITGKGDHVGGIVGQAYGGHIVSCYNGGTITEINTSGTYFVGGIAGSDGYLANCLNTGTVNTSNAGQTAGFGALMGHSFKPIANADDACYYLDSSSTVAADGKAQENCIAVTADQLAGREVYPEGSSAFLVEALNVGAHAGAWVDGARAAVPQNAPMLSWLVVPGQPYSVVASGDTLVNVSSAGALSVTASLPPAGEVGSDGVLSYQWYTYGTGSDGSDEVVEGATSAQLPLSSATPLRVQYYCLVTNTWSGGSASCKSNKVEVVYSATGDPSVPVVAVLGVPADGAVSQFSTHELTAGVSFAAGEENYETPLNVSYQWYSSLSPEGPFAPIPNATDAAYTVPTSELGTVYYQVGVVNEFYGLKAPEAFSEVQAVTVREFSIQDMEDLHEFSGKVAAGTSFEGASVFLASDIDASGEEFAGIGSGTSNVFKGTFEGGGHEISNIALTGRGLFNITGDGCTVKDLVLSGTLTPSADNAGMAAGIFKGRMSGVSVSGSIVTNREKIGGVVGELSGEGSIAGCTSQVALTLTYDGNTQPVAGGVVGTASYTTSISDCVFTGSIDGSTVASVLGGIVGKTGSGTQVSGCIAKANITGKQHIGGIAGRLETNSAVVQDCEFAGALSGLTHVGGIVGYLGGTSVGTYTVKDCLASGTVAATGAEGCAGGIVGTAEYQVVTVSGCLALQSSVSGGIGFTGRVVGNLKQGGWGGSFVTPEPDDCHAWEAMLVNGEVVEKGAETATADGKDGEVLVTSTLKGANVYAPCASWNSQVWLLAPAAKPQLRASSVVAEASTAALPDYMSNVVSVPVFEDVVFTGTEHSIKAGEGYTLTGTTIATAAGAYIATATLTGSNAQWADATSASKQVEWRITPVAASALSVQLAPDIFAYSGAANMPDVSVKLGGVDMAPYVITDVSDNVDVGWGKVTVHGDGVSVTGSTEALFAIAKAENTLSVTASDPAAVSYSEAARVLASPLAVSDAQGALSYEKVSGASVLSVDSVTGKVTVAEKAPAGTYELTIRVTAAGDANHESASASRSVTVSVTKAAGLLSVTPVQATQVTTYGKQTSVPAAKAFRVEANASGGKVTYAKASGDARISVAGDGAIAVAKGLAAGTYAVTAKATAAATANYEQASTTVAFKVNVAKAANTLKLTGKTATVKAAKVKKAAQKVKAAKVVKVVKNASKGKLTYKKVSGNKKIAVAKNGEITVKKGLVKGAYKVKVKATSKATKNYKQAAKTITAKIVVR